jgi:hypothetical protein
MSYLLFVSVLHLLSPYILQASLIICDLCSMYFLQSTFTLNLPMYLLSDTYVYLMSDTRLLDFVDAHTYHCAIYCLLDNNFL